MKLDAKALRGKTNTTSANLQLLLIGPTDDGYRLTYGGLDYLALNTYQKQQVVYSVGNQIGVGKESDIIAVAEASGTQRILKIHRLGRISFRSIKNNRDYLRHRSSASWMYMSRLAAIKEFAFMKALRDNGFSVPEPISQNRHTIVMSMIDAFPLRQISSVPNPAALYAELIDTIMELAKFGLIHGDYNEFNILIKEEEIPTETNEESKDKKEDNVKLTPVVIDFPQMVSVDHANAEMYFDRDVNCIKRYFQRRFGFVSDEPGPFFSEARKLVGTDGTPRLDVAVEASGFSKKMAKELEAYMKEVGVDGDARDIGDDEGQDVDDDQDIDEYEENDDDDDLDQENGNNGHEKSETNEQLEEKPQIHDPDTKIGMEKLTISEPS
ncbi:atypical/RIO/RIO2 protein kinase [Nannizzia gypsea CBS 118893]|uniref:non-specific serine/threonine protein kinase n=1 Tax=Arthroderma gypseum (strain ATCC MYA-4604 / CBS 118893) TaxID=535722 RepID=E4UYP5_ARTGP|nr:atypical/RIO/RIO2 protein kinase [Nannizzia gypsea CBS 118893]EFR03225.1 atypical/RIO/RIO2 protein kinase [Nannizzia gypsea CBS 118893]